MSLDVAKALLDMRKASCARRSPADARRRESMERGFDEADAAEEKKEVGCSVGGCWWKMSTRRVIYTDVVRRRPQLCLSS